MQTLRKKTSPLKYKNETSRFLGEGVSFKAKLIGILEVSEARGDRMCQDALSDLKMAIRAAGEHKQRITINIAIDGLRLRDEKTGDSLYHHPVHKISFIAQDMSDSRAFGYIFGSPDTGHRFFGIKTDKAASQVVIAMRDLFQVVFALKKKEIELAKQHLDKNRSPLFSETSSSVKTITQESTKTTDTESKAGATNVESRPTPAVADLVDLELELNSLQQGLTQMERITPSDPFGSKDDPFGDSFTSYPQKPILPPPPSGRERSSRTSETSSIFSPKTPQTADTISAGESAIINISNFSHEFNSSHDEPSSGDWFTPPPGNSLLEESSALVPEPQKDQHEIAKQEILSQFDVFTELDPLGTGKVKPYIDKKHFFQELKNPPKKVLNDLVSESQQPQEQSLFTSNFDQSTMNKLNSSGSNNLFGTDPFGEDPFDKTDPFADFSKQDPFESEFNADFKETPKTNELPEKFKFPVPKTDIPPLFPSVLSKSPKSSFLEKQLSLATNLPRNVQFSKQNTFDAQFDKFEEKKFGKLSQMHENPSLDLSSESECAPEPPPRPTSNLTQIKPPPLPPKKQPGDFTNKPPPRPPHTEDSHYNYIDTYETGSNSLEFIKNLENSPPIPVPSRKSKFESDFTGVPERPRKQFNLQTEEDYLAPISLPVQKKDHVTRHAGPLLLPPPQRSNRKQNSNQQNIAQVTVASFLESKPNVTTSIAADKLNCSLEGLDITLSQLTLNGLNELASKLHIPASQLSNMTLVQLTSYLSNFIKNCTNVNNNSKSEIHCIGEEPSFEADFAANFNNLSNANTSSSETYDRYAVFRELFKEEIKQTKIDAEPEEIAEEKEKEESIAEQKINNLNVIPITESSSEVIDKYAALREIVENEIKQVEEKNSNSHDSDSQDPSVLEQNTINEQNTFDESLENKVNIINSEKKFIVEDKNKEIISPKDIIEYNTSMENKNDIKDSTPIKSPTNKLVKSPVPVAVTDVIQNAIHLNSGSLSDVISGSSPEVDNTGSASEVAKKPDATAESWAIFDQPILGQESSKEKQNVQSEEGVSPWSSDSKEFGNGSPPEWRQRGDSGSGGDQWGRRGPRRDQEGWWDTSAEPEVQYYPSNRRSTDSYDEEYYECYDRPRRRRQANLPGQCGQAAGGHSSSSRDVSPWEEEPRRRDHRDHRDGREPRQTWASRHTRQHSFDVHRDRRHTDSWDEEDDYEYEEEHSSRFHWPDRHISREADRERHSAGSRDVDSDRWGEEWTDDRRHRRRRDADRERWCCPDWEQEEKDKPSSRYNSGRWSGQDVPPGKWRDRKHEDRYYSRDSQESPWEDEYSNDPEDTHSSHYLTAKRVWKRPSSASEMDRKTGEIKLRQGQYYLGTGGSDGERDRRYKSGRRSKSRDSQFSEPAHRHKPEPGPTLRNLHRTKQHQKPHFENDFIQDVASKKVDPAKAELSNKKSSTLTRSKKPKESPKTEEINASTFPRKSNARVQSLFENDFVTSETESPVSARVNARFNFENEFETSEAESPIVNKIVKTSRASCKVDMRKSFDSEYVKDSRRQPSNYREMKPSRFQNSQKSLFEDDFSPTEKLESEETGISSIKEEATVNEEEDSFSSNNFDRTTNSRKKILSKNRFSACMRPDINLKKSDSVNIFARENDPFDDDFFSCKDSSSSMHHVSRENMALRNTELKWTEEFQDFGIQDRK